ncbi:hypothetical protein EAS62_37090 [Bradyrhizobium zhanjiangense]|uniref:Transposase Tn5-like N-terminal domain-containing protein n=1 Tax=Bradyrhizobium zhanjiangense TaxID=1325107 RepID=A0ABY0DAM3_9BRAD|nr:hypothetical protein EAS62_37090 [Bradyrhizobium zhanjiangense]
MLYGADVQGSIGKTLFAILGECWIDREIVGCEFRDARLGGRFRKLLTQIGDAMRNKAFRSSARLGEYQGSLPPLLQ